MRCELKSHIVFAPIFPPTYDLAAIVNVRRSLQQPSGICRNPFIEITKTVLLIPDKCSIFIRGWAGRSYNHVGIIDRVGCIVVRRQLECGRLAFCIQQNVFYVELDHYMPAIVYGNRIAEAFLGPKLAPPVSTVPQESVVMPLGIEQIPNRLALIVDGIRDAAAATTDVR